MLDVYHVHFPSHSREQVGNALCTEFGGATLWRTGVFGVWIDDSGEAITDEMDVWEVATDCRRFEEVAATLAAIGRNAAGETCVYVKAERHTFATIAYPDEVNK